GKSLLRSFAELVGRYCSDPSQLVELWFDRLEGHFFDSLLRGLKPISPVSPPRGHAQPLYCEICGNEIVGKPARSLVEGATLIVCQQCSGLGKELPGFAERRPRAGRLGSVPSHTRTPIESLPKAVEDSDLVEDYPEVVKGGREKMG